MGTEANGGKSPRLRVSAWLPPDLALAWLATLATFLRGVGMVLSAWGATVSAVLLAVLLTHWLRRGGAADDADDGDPVAGNEDAAAGENAATGERARASTRCPTDPDETAPRPVPAESSAADGKNPDSDPGLAAGTPVAPGSPVPELRVLTAEETASVLRVDTELVKASISSGELLTA